MSSANAKLGISMIHSKLIIEKKDEVESRKPLQGECVHSGYVIETGGIERKNTSVGWLSFMIIYRIPLQRGLLQAIQCKN